MRTARLCRFQTRQQHAKADYTSLCSRLRSLSLFSLCIVAYQALWRARAASSHGEKRRRAHSALKSQGDTKPTHFHDNRWPTRRPLVKLQLSGSPRSQSHPHRTRKWPHCSLSECANRYTLGGPQARDSDCERSAQAHQAQKCLNGDTPQLRATDTALEDLDNSTYRWYQLVVGKQSWLSP